MIIYLAFHTTGSVSMEEVFPQIKQLGFHFKPGLCEDLSSSAIQRLHIFISEMVKFLEIAPDFIIFSQIGFVILKGLFHKNVFHIVFV